MIEGIKLFIVTYFAKGITKTTLLQRTKLLSQTNPTTEIDKMRSIDCPKLDLRTVFDHYIKHILASAEQNSSFCKCKPISHFDISLDEDIVEIKSLISNYSAFYCVASKKE